MTGQTTPTPDGEPLAVVDAGPLPTFEGLQPIGVVTRLTGTGDRIARALGLDERIVLVVEAQVVDVRHPITDDGVKRAHVLKAVDLYELPGRPGQRLLTTVRHAWRVADDARHGRTALEGVGEAVDGVELSTDGSGVVITADELADLGVGSGGVDPIVVILDGGQRSIWPDDYPVGVDRPDAGDTVDVPGGEGEAQVVELLDAVTGETVAAWSDADEDARLARLEAEAEAAEAAEEEGPTEGQLVNRQPWPGYDEAKAGDVVQRVQAADEVALVEHVVAYEEAHKGRTTVLAVARVVADELAATATDDADRPPLPGEEV